MIAQENIDNVHKYVQKSSKTFKERMLVPNELC